METEHPLQTESRPTAAPTTLPAIRTPDQRVRVFVSSTLDELAPERAAAREAITQLHLTPVLFESGARPYPPRELYRAYLAQSDIFIGIYWQRYGWVAPDMTISGLEDEYLLSGNKPKLIYIKSPSPERETRLKDLLARVQSDDTVSYKYFTTPEELHDLVANDLALLLTESFETVRTATAHSTFAPLTPPLSHDTPLPTEGPTPTPPIEDPTSPIQNPKSKIQNQENLPVQRTPLIGRERELSIARSLLLRDDVGLVTLTGPGGCGTTRLRVTLGLDMLSTFPDGVFQVLLAPLPDPAR